nr:helix-turn-helix domain-containing protein [Mycobacterium malmoense]
MRCVARAGYSRATIREIARGAGVTSASLYNYFPNKAELMKAAIAARTADMTSGSLYHYFPNKSELLDAVAEDVERIALPRLRAAAGRADGVVDRLGSVLDEASRLMREHPHLAAFDRAVRAESNEHPERSRPGDPGLKALRDTISELLDDARAGGALPPGTEPGAAADAVHALARGLTERAASLDDDAYAAALASAKLLIGGTLFAAAEEK